MSSEPILLKVLRYDPDADRAPRYELYRIPWQQGLLLLGALKYIRDNLDDTLAFRDYCCGCSWCQSCLMSVDGQGTQTCSRPLKPGEALVVEPMRGFPIIRDLVVDFGVTVTAPDGVYKIMEGTVLRKEKFPPAVQS
jgi:succinate dehydrogenase/fumarate reductase-like Fe-S protein